MAVTQRDERSFQVDLTALEGGFWRRLSQRRVRVDPYLVAKAIFSVMDFCEHRDVRGKRLMWNDYRVFLSQEDYDGLAPIISRLEQDLASLLQERFNEGGATLMGGLNVDLLVSEGERLPPSTVVVQPSFHAWSDQRDSAGSAVTVRAGRKAAQPPPAHATHRVADPNDPDATLINEDQDGLGLVVRWGTHSAQVGAGMRVVFGRPHADAAGSFVPLHGATNEINRRQLFIEPGPEGSAVIGRLSSANAVQVNGRLVQPGGQLAVTRLPVEVSLSKGALVLTVETERP
ncbi:MAG: FhaA domain-containing protein [Myxococcota bacterium]